MPYGIEFRCVAVKEAKSDRDGFTVHLTDGRRERSRFLLLATGVKDQLPEVPGVAECYGRSVFHCPYCDGWECRDKRLAVLGRARGAARALAEDLEHDVVLCTHGKRLDLAARRRLKDNGIALRTATVARLAHVDGRVTTIEFVDGDRLPCEALFFGTGQYQQDSLAERLGCAFNRKGTVNTGTLQRHERRRVCSSPAMRRATRSSSSWRPPRAIKAAVAINKALQRMELR